MISAGISLLPILWGTFLGITTSEVVKRHFGGLWEQQTGHKSTQSTDSQREPPRRTRVQIDARKGAMNKSKCSPLGADETKTPKFTPWHEEKRVRQEADKLWWIKSEMLLHNNAVLTQALCAQWSGEPMAKAENKGGSHLEKLGYIYSKTFIILRLVSYLSIFHIWHNYQSSFLICYKTSLWLLRIKWITRLTVTIIGICQSQISHLVFHFLLLFSPKVTLYWVLTPCIMVFAILNMGKIFPFNII